MKIKLTNKTYYERHFKVLERYTNNCDFIHLIGSRNNFLSNQTNTIVIEKEDIVSYITPNQKFDTVTMTDFFETSDDIYTLLIKSKSLLQPQGKLIISTINFRLAFLIKLFEFLRLKNKSPKLSQINEKHLINLAQMIINGLCS